MLFISYDMSRCGWYIIVFVVIPGGCLVVVVIAKIFAGFQCLVIQ